MTSAKNGDVKSGAPDGGASHADQALARIDEAPRIDPRYAHAHWDRAHILYETKKDLAGAAKSLETFLTLIPQGQDPDRARALLTEMRRSGATSSGKPTSAEPRCLTLPTMAVSICSRGSTQWAT